VQRHRSCRAEHVHSSDSTMPGRRLRAASLLAAALPLLLALSPAAAEEIEINPFGGWDELRSEDGELIGDLNGDGKLDEHELAQIEEAAQTMSEQFKAQLKAHLAERFRMHKDGGSKLKRSRVASMEMALHSAAADNQYEVVERLLAKGADPDGGYPEQGVASPLHAAAEGGFKDLVDLLLEHNATVDAKGPGGATPLHLAARKGRASVVELLLRNGAATDESGIGGSALYVAAEMGHTLVVRLLVAANASIDLRGGDGMTPLHIAASEGHIGAATELIAAGAEVDAKDDSGVRPLTLANLANHLDMEHLLLQAGAAVISDEEQESAAQRRRLGSVKVDMTTVTFAVQAGRRDAPD